MARTRRSLCSGLVRAKTSMRRHLASRASSSISSIWLTGDVGFAVADTQHLGDAGPRHGVVAGDHGHPDAALVAFLNGGYGLIARRIDNTDEAESTSSLVRPWASKLASSILASFSQASASTLWPLIAISSFFFSQNARSRGA